MTVGAAASNRWTVRQATPGDESGLLRLIERAGRVVLRFHPKELADYLSRKPFLLAEKAERLRGFLACFVSHPPRAALAAAGLADDWAILPWLDRLLPPCQAYLHEFGVTSLSYVGAAAWLVGPLQARGFHLVSNIVAYEKRDWAIPENGDQTIKVRPAQPADFSALVAMDAMDFHPLWRNSAETLSQWRETLPYFVVAVAGEKRVGYCYCSLEDKHGHLVRMAVHPAWQERGIGTRLVAEAVGFFRQAGTQLITLNTQEENKVAQRLYRNFGFQLIGQEAVALWKDLQP